MSVSADLKLIDPCLYAFEEWMRDRGIVAERNENQGDGIFKDSRVEAMWEGFCCAWFLRGPKPENLPAGIREAVSGAIRGRHTPSSLIESVLAAVHPFLKAQRADLMSVSAT